MGEFSTAIRESGKFLLVKSGILGFGVRNLGIPLTIGIQNPSSTDKYWNPVESQSSITTSKSRPHARFEIFIAYSKISTLDSGFKKLRIHQKRVDGSRIPIEKVANSIRSLNVTLNA